MKATPAAVDKALALLTDTPRRIGTVTGGREDAGLRAAPAGKVWSPVEILAHLRACADLWTHSIYAMLAAEKPALPDVDERKWARAARYAEPPFEKSFQAFQLQRESLLVVLHGLPPGAWDRPALIFERTHTVFSQARRMALHEAEHCDQLEALLKR